MLTHRATFVSLAIFAFVAVTVLPALQRGSNCGGNNEALSNCKQYALILQMWADDHPRETFRYESSDRETQRLLGYMDSVGSDRYLARLNDVRMDPRGDRQIIMVCVDAYSNVPRHLFWKAPLTHAVAYSTGETGLISPDEFWQLDLDEFVDLQKLTE